ncbi:MAG: hypothetical protein ACEPOZ_00180 [Marinifilaceae bacterium]
MKKLRLLLMMMFVLTAIGVQAQNVNTGKKPYEGSIHTYEVKKGMTASTLAWSVTGSRGVDYDFVEANGDVISGTDAPTGTSVNILWKKANATAYTVRVVETRTDFAGGCPTPREMEVTVVANQFDIYAELADNSISDACAAVNDPVLDEGTLGDNSDDTFGTTQRVFKVKAYNLPTNASSNTLAWNYTFTLVNVKTGTTTDEGLVVNISVDGNSHASGDKINVAEGTAESTVTVSYTTNSNRQDADLDLVLEITAGADALGTLDNDGKTGSSNKATYLVRAVPATTGITTDN